LANITEDVFSFISDKIGDKTYGSALSDRDGIRWIFFSKIRGCKNVLNFSPPAKPFNRLGFNFLCLLFNFSPIIQKSFLRTVTISSPLLYRFSDIIEIPPERLGIVLGKPTIIRKGIVIAAKGKAKKILKFPLTAKAVDMIYLENDGLRLACNDSFWLDHIPVVYGSFKIKNHLCLLMERVIGSTLTPGKLSIVLNCVANRKSRLKGTIREWCQINNIPSCQEEIEAYAECDATGALDEVSYWGLIHGDFTTWNAILGDRLVFVDWEFARENAPFLFDYAYAIHSSIKHFKRLPPSVKIDSSKLLRYNAIGKLWFSIRHFGKPGLLLTRI